MFTALFNHKRSSGPIYITMSCDMFKDNIITNNTFIFI